MESPNTYYCPAKVNLALSVGAPLDNGFHPIASWMVAVSLYDDLTVEKVDPSSSFDIQWADDALRPSEIDWPVEKDLAFRAHQLIEQHVGRPLPVRVTLRKRIPVGGGLAGGSSNGATMLRALNELFDLNLPRQTLIDIAMQLGSDLAFFLGEPSAIITGLGEGLEPAPRPEPIHLALAVPAFGCPTGAVYKMFDTMLEGAKKETVPFKAGGQSPFSQVRELTRRTPLPPDAPFNDLAAPACAVEPALAVIRQQAEEIARRPVHITGSGSGMFVIADTADHASELADQLATQLDLATVSAQTL